MSAITRTERGRVGTALIAAGALLLALASAMTFGVAAADATHNDGHEVGLCHWNNGAKQWNYLSNLQLPHSGHDGHEHDFNASSEEECLSTPPPGDDTTTTTTVAEETTTTTVAEETTTTTVAEETTTTTVAGVEEPTTTLASEETTTTVVAGPDDTMLPETGAGHILALMAGGLGLALMGSGSLVIAGERRRSIVL
jgi:hypothetical protein